MIKWIETFFSFLSSYLSLDDKIHFKDQFSKDIEKELENLYIQIQFQDLNPQERYPKWFQLNLTVWQVR
jgi:hypothetical protein